MSAVQAITGRSLLNEGDPAVAEALAAQIEQAGRILSPSGLDDWLDGAEALVRLGRGASPVVAWIETIPSVARECGEDIIDDCLSAAMKMASMTSGEVITLVFRSLPGAAHHLGDGALVRTYLEFLHRFASTAARGLRPMLGQMDELLSRLTLTGLRRWANFGAEAYRRDFNNLVAYFALESADSKAMLQQERRGVLFNQVQRKLNLYLRALWGRDFFLRPIGADHLDARPYLESHILYLPDAVDAIGEVSGLEFYRATAAHMAAHLCYSSSAISAEELSPAQMFFIGLFEDARVEYQAAREFPGVQRLWRSLLSTDTTREVLHPSLVMLKQTAVMLNDPSHTIEAAGDAGEIEHLVRCWHDEVAERADDHQLSWQYGIALFTLMATRRAVPSLRLLEQLDIPYRDDNRIVWSFQGVDFDAEADWLPGHQAQVRRKVNVMEMVNEVDCELAGEDSQEIWTLESELRPYEDDLVSTPSYNETEGREPVSGPFHYGEWDYRIQLQRPDWATVHERRSPRGDPGEIDQILQKYKSVTFQIRRIIDLLSPAGVQRMRRQEDGDEIDLNAAIDAMVAIRMGGQPGSRVTLRNVLAMRDLAVVVLLDLSESTNDTVPGSTHTILELTREAAALVSTAIDGIGDNFAVHGYASDGRHDVRYYRIKDFNERFGEDAQARLAGMRGGLSTRMGAALRHAGSHLARQPERRKLILLVTDGEPADIDERDPQHLRADAKKAVEELHSQGVLTYCLTLDPQADSYARRIFGEHRYTVIDHVERLPEELPVLFASLTS